MESWLFFFFTFLLLSSQIFFQLAEGCKHVYTNFLYISHGLVFCGRMRGEERRGEGRQRGKRWPSWGFASP